MKKSESLKFCVALFLLLATFKSSFSTLPNSNKIWYFGAYAGIDFNTPIPTALTNGSINTYDNASAISDIQGSLICYSDGQTVWNKFHQIMPNGSGLLGNRTGGQPALFIRQPNGKIANSSTIYIFTVPEYGSGGMKYSTVDLTLDSLRGDIQLKNIPLYSSTCEKLAAIYNSNDESYWIISHEFGNANFVCHKLNSNGLNLNPVISNVGDSNNGGTYGYDHGSMGQLVISEDGMHIANAMEYSGKIQLLDFDIQTGIISNPISIPNQSNAWGVAFSPDGNKLYATSWLSSNVWQYDLTSYNATDIINSKLNLGSITNPNATYKAGYIKLAPDGKIYIAKYSSHFLATINNPDAPGVSCNFVDNSFNLGSGTSTAGLATSVVFPNSITGIAELSESVSTLYPNPTISSFTIKTEFNISEKFEISVYDINGKSIFINYSINSNTINFNLIGISKGTYFYTIQGEQKVTKGKFIVQ